MWLPLFLAVLPALTFGHPADSLRKRYDTKSADISSVGTNDLNVVSYALVLEHLETAFYEGALDKFSPKDFTDAGLDSSLYLNIQRLAKDEATHVDYLTKALQAAGSAAVPPCTYKFPYTDVSSFVALAAILEGVGVSAYSGAASSIKSGDIITAAAGILPIEARHAAIIREAIGLEPFPNPFDTPLDFNQVFSLASQFIDSCPFDIPFNLKAFPALSMAASNGAGPWVVGQTITLETPGYMLVPANSTLQQRDTAQLYATFLTISGPVFVAADRTSSTTYDVTIPEGLSGQTYVVLSSCDEKLSDGTTAAGPVILEIDT